MSAPAVVARSRPLLKRYRPNRAAANFYRAAVDDPNAIGGVPVDNVEAAVTAAVRLGYKIAQAQIDRTTRVAKRLRAAGDEATGGGSDKKALDATEQLVFKSMLAALSWLEGVAADRSNPLKRFASAEFRLLGSLLGLLPPDTPGAGNGRPSEDPSRRDDVAEFSSRPTASRPPRSSRGRPTVKHALTGNTTRAGRPVRIREWELAADASGPYLLTFYRDTAGAGTIRAELRVTRTGATTLTVNTSGKTAAGLYKAAICDKEGVQLGYVEILL